MKTKIFLFLISLILTSPLFASPFRFFAPVPQKIPLPSSLSKKLSLKFFGLAKFHRIFLGSQEDPLSNIPISFYCDVIKREISWLNLRWTKYNCRVSPCHYDDLQGDNEHWIHFSSRNSEELFELFQSHSIAQLKKGQKHSHFEFAGTLECNLFNLSCSFIVSQY